MDNFVKVMSIREIPTVKTTLPNELLEKMRHPFGESFKTNGITVKETSLIPNTTFT